MAPTDTPPPPEGQQTDSRAAGEQIRGRAPGEVTRVLAWLLVGGSISAAIAHWSTFETITADFFFTSAQVIGALLIAFGVEARAVYDQLAEDAKAAARLMAVGGLGLLGAAAALAGAEWDAAVPRAVCFAFAFAGFARLGLAVAVTYPASAYFKRFYGGKPLTMLGGVVR